MEKRTIPVVHRCRQYLAISKLAMELGMTDADNTEDISLLIALFGPKEHSITKHWNSKFFLNCFIS